MLNYSQLLSSAIKKRNQEAKGLAESIVLRWGMLSANRNDP